MSTELFLDKEPRGTDLSESETLLRALTEVSMDAVVVVGSDGRFRYANPAHERLTGYSASAIAGQKFVELIHPEDRRLVAEQLAALVQNPEQTIALETRVLHRDGSVRSVEATGKALPNGDFAGYLRDVTERRRDVAARQASEANFRTLVEISVDGIVIVRLDTILGYANAPYLRALGYAYDEVVGHSFIPFVHPDDLDDARAKIAQLLQNPDQSTTAKLRVRHKDGSWRLLEGVGKLMPDGNIVAYTRDITERKLAEEKQHESEERFRAFVEVSPIGIVLVNSEGAIRYASPAYARFSGYEGEDLVGQSFLSLAHPDEISRVASLFADVLQHPDRIIVAEYQHLHKDSVIRIAEATGKVLPNGDIVGFVRDITAQKQAEDQLRQLNEALEQRVAERTAQLEAAFAERANLAQILEATSDMVAFATLDGKPLYLNRAGRRMIGLPADLDVTTLSFADIYPPHVLEMIATVGLPTAMRDGTWSGEVMVKHWDGHVIPVSIVGIIHFGPDGVPTHLSAIIRDITAQRRAEEELREAKDAAEAANKAKSAFLANMSHEIRTPMNAVIGMTSLLLNTPLDEKQRDFVETIRTSGDALLTIINDILDFSKIEAGKLDLERQPLDLRSCIESALDLLAPRVVEKGIDLVYELGDEVPGGIVGDVTRLRQILVNLIGNAIKFTERGEVVVSVGARGCGLGAGKQRPNLQPLTPSLYELHVSVKDTGIGIPPDKLGRLFQSFSQLDASTTREYGGTGLGLAISKRLAELMGGTMWAESAGTGQGAAFHFTIRAEAAPAPVRVHLRSRQPLLADKRLLVVDDHPTNRRILSLQAQTWGMECVTAASPEAALALLRAGQRFDLAVLDMHMPEMDGAALAAAMCAEHARQGRHFPLILLTSLGYETRPELEAVKCFAAYLTKPVKPSQLYDVLIGLLVGEDPAGRLPPRAPAAASAPTQLATQLPLRILLAEDVAVNQKFALLALEDLGYSADVAANGREVLAALQRQMYDVILMDVQMPELDGLEATRRIRREFGAERQPHIIAMTANAMQGDRELCLEAGMDDYISKPVYLDELRAALERVGQRAVAIESALLDRTVVARVLAQRRGRELIELYIAEAGQLLTELAAAAAQGDLAEVQRLAHGLKSSSRYVGASGMGELSEQLEALARDGALAQAPPMAKELQHVFGRTREQLLGLSRSH